ncbi:putative vitamin H transporter [Sarocladium strictum]
MASPNAGRQSSNTIPVERIDSLENGKTTSVAVANIEEDYTKDLRRSPEARMDFLATFTADDEKVIMRKVDARFLILIGTMFLFKNIAFSNVAIIRTMQLGTENNIMVELGFSIDRYNLLATVQGIAYIIFELPSNLLLKWMTPHSLQARIFFTWGIATACCGAVHNSTQLIACRWLVGMLEAGMFPAVITTLSFWYRTDEIGRPILVYFSIAQFSSIFGSLACYGTSFMNGLQGLSGWRWAFILEGIATVLLSIVIYFVLPDFPKSKRSNSWLTPREQQFIEARLPPHAPATADSSWNTQDAIIALKSPTTWGFLFDQTLMNLSLYALNWILPSIIAGLGFAGLPSSLLLNIPPAAAGIVAMGICVLVTSRAWAPRPLICVVVVFGAVVCYILFFTVSNTGALYFACILSQFFGASYYVPYWSWRTSIMSGSTGAAFAIGLQSSIAQLGAVVGPQFFPAKWAADRYRNSYLIGLVITIAALLSNLWTWWLTRKIERQIQKVRRSTLQANKEGKGYTGESDIDVLNDPYIKNRKWW